MADRTLGAGPVAAGPVRTCSGSPFEEPVAGGWPVMIVDTTRAVDVEAVAARLCEMIISSATEAPE